MDVLFDFLKETNEHQEKEQKTFVQSQKDIIDWYVNGTEELRKEGEDTDG